MSLAKLTSVSTQTLSLLLERQRLQTMTSGPNNTNLPQIARNLGVLRTGILAMEAEEKGKAGGKSMAEAVTLLRSQYERMRSMLGEDADRFDVESLQVSLKDKPQPAQEVEAEERAPPPPAKDVPYAPYRDDPHQPQERECEPDAVMLQQRMVMEEQDAQLDHLSHSIGRQHHISLQINEELDVHTGLLEELDHELDHTEGRLSRARRKLDKVARGVKGNGSTVTIAVLILILLILIIVFKT